MDDDSYLRAGLPIVPVDSDINYKNWIRPDMGRGWITKIDHEDISIYFERGYGSGTIKAVIARNRFGNFFKPTRQSVPDNKAYILSKHYPRRYPEDFEK